MQPKVIFITGMSGAGRSSALKIFEDIGYAIIDNLPHYMLKDFLDGIIADKVHLPVVVGFDIRAYRGDPFEILPIIQRFKTHLETRLIFLDCQDGVLLKRYSATRHRHPLSGESVPELIKSEREILAPLMQAADHLIDTSMISVITLGRIIKKVFTKNPVAGLEIFVTSFSYKRGLPAEADIVFDARFLDNPFYEENLKKLTGKDPEVGRFIAQDKEFLPVLESIKTMLMHALSGYKRSGRTYLTIAFGCTGGQHRSVYMAEMVGAYLRELAEMVNIEHRDVDEAVKKYD